MYICQIVSRVLAPMRTGYLDFDPGQADKYFAALQSGDRFIVPHVMRKVQPLSVRRRKGVSQKSLLPLCSQTWAGLSSGERSAWNSAAAYSGLNGWRLFVKDYCYRVVNGLPGVATPSNLHQALVGQLHLEGAHPELKIFQPHPQSYYIARKVPGSKSMYSPVVVEERLVLPLQIGLSYKSDLSLTEPDGFARFYAVTRRLYQGNNLDEFLTIELDLSHDWQTTTATLSYILGQYTAYVLYFHCYHVSGDLFIDNVKSVHSSVNWARDPQCNDIHQDFTRAFYQVPKNWAQIEMTDGCFFESVYF